MLPQAPPPFQPLKILPMFLTKTKPCWNARKLRSNLCLTQPKCKKIRPFTEEQVKLGQQLWYENRLSKGNTVSCNSCHNLATAGVDNMPTSAGHKSQFGGRNSPTALNAALLGSQFWDGRAADVEEQAGGPLLNPVEMANASEADAAAKSPVFLNTKRNSKPHSLKTARFPSKTLPLHWVHLNVPC